MTAISSINLEDVNSLVRVGQTFLVNTIFPVHKYKFEFSVKPKTREIRITERDISKISADLIGDLESTFSFSAGNSHKQLKEIPYIPRFKREELELKIYRLIKKKSLGHVEYFEWRLNFLLGGDDPKKLAFINKAGFFKLSKPINKIYMLFFSGTMYLANRYKGDDFKIFDLINFQNIPKPFFQRQQTRVSNYNKVLRAHTITQEYENIKHEKIFKILQDFLILPLSQIVIDYCHPHNNEINLFKEDLSERSDYFERLIFCYERLIEDAKK